MDKDVEESIRRHNRAIWLVLILLLLLTCIGVALSLMAKPTVVKNYIGKQGAPGISVIGPEGPQGLQGIQGLQGEQGPPGPGPTASQIADAVAAYLQGNPPPAGPQGPPGIQGDQGATGATGQDGKSPEFRCYNGDYQWRYVGDEDWQTLQEKSKACQGPDQ